MQLPRFISRFAYAPSDDDSVRLEKKAILVVAGSCTCMGLVWALMYQWAFGWGLTTALPLVFTAVVGVALAVSHATKDHRYAVYAQILCIIQITAFIQWSIGGAFDSGFVLAWAFCGPVAALAFFPPRRAAPWLGLYLFNVVVTVVFDDVFASNGLGVDAGTRMLFLVMNLCISSVVVFVFAVFFVHQALDQRARADALLLNILPEEIAPRLKSGDTIADAYDSASVLFADMVGSTPTFAGMPPEQVVSWLDEVFSAFDRLTEKHGVEKIRTIGDNYMVAAGVPTPRTDHAEALIAFALDMLHALEKVPARNGRTMRFRIGIHSGPLVAGVLGEVKFQYDLWGDTVNVASRMESHGEAGRVHVSDATRALAADAFAFTSRGPLDIKGKGQMGTWFVEADPRHRHDTVAQPALESR